MLAQYGALVGRPQVGEGTARKGAGQEAGHVVSYRLIRETHWEEGLLDVKVAVLQQERDLRRHTPKRAQEILFKGRDGDIGGAVVGGDAGPTVEGPNFLVGENAQPARRVCRSRGRYLPAIRG